MTNILRSKGNQAIKFGQLIEYNIENILLKNHTRNVLEKLLPDLFLKYQNWAYLWIKSVNFIQFVLILCQVEGYQYIELSYGPFAFTPYKLFSKDKKRLVSLSGFLHDFWKIFFILLYFITWPNFIDWLHLLREILGNMYWRCFLTRNKCHKFWK